jgi:hypothetical protein
VARHLLRAGTATKDEEVVLAEGTELAAPVDVTVEQEFE